MDEPDVVAKARLLELESMRMSEANMEEWRRLHRQIWGGGDEPASFMVSASTNGELLFKAGLALEEALKLARVNLRNGVVAVTIQHLEGG